MDDAVKITITEREALDLAYAALASVDAHRDSHVMQYAVPALMGQAKAIEASQHREAAKQAAVFADGARPGTQYCFGLVWRDSPGSRTSTSLGPYSDKATGEGEFAETLVKLGYSAPRWWQYWRWGESRPSERVLRLIDFMKPTRDW